MNMKKNHRKGFSLVELVVVILIIAILAVAVFAGGSAVIKKSQVSRTTSDLHNFSVAVESTLNETPAVANMGNYKDMAAGKMLEKLNLNLAEDYQLELLTSESPEVKNTSNNIKSTKGAPADTDSYFIAKSKKTDAWDNSYYVIFDTQDRNGLGKSDFFITVISAGPDAKTNLDGAIGGTNAIAETNNKADDIFLLVQYTDGDVSAVAYNCASDTSIIKNRENGLATTYQAAADATDKYNKTSPVNF